MPPVKQDTIKPKIEIGISDKELEKNSDLIYLEKTMQILNLNTF